MARLWISRILLLYSTLTTLLLAASLPRPSFATAAQTGKQALFLALAGTCVVTFVLLGRRPFIGWRMAGALGIFGAVMLCLRGRVLWLFAHSGETMYLAAAAVDLSLWCALVIAGICSIGRSRQSAAAVKST